MENLCPKFYMRTEFPLGRVGLRTCHGIFVLVNQVLRHIFLHELVRWCRHPSVHERREIEERGSIKREFVVDELISGLCGYPLRQKSRQMAVQCLAHWWTYFGGDVIFRDRGGSISGSVRMLDGVWMGLCKSPKMSFLVLTKDKTWSATQKLIVTWDSWMSRSGLTCCIMIVRRCKGIILFVDYL